MCTLWVFVSQLHASVCVSAARTGVCTLCVMSFCERISDCVCICACVWEAWR